MTLLTLTHSRNDLKLFCLILRTDLTIIVVVRRSWTVRRAAPYKSLIVFVLYLVTSWTRKLKTAHGHVMPHSSICMTV